MTLISPTRFRFDATQLGAAIALARVQRSERAMLPDLPAPADPLAALRGTPALTAAGTLDPACAATLAALADPVSLTSIVANRAGPATDWTEALVARGGESGPFVGYPGPGRYDYVLLPTLTQAALYADELLSLTVGPSQAGEEVVHLSLRGLAAFAALADAVQAAKLQALLARAAAAQLTWTAAQLEEIFAAGLTAEDTRWATTAIRHVSPAPLAAARGHLAEGLPELERSRLVTRAGSGWTLTAAGYSRAAAFGQLVTSGAVELAGFVGRGKVALVNASFFRSVLGIWILTWTNASPEAAAVELEEVTAGTALELVRSLLRPAVPLPVPEAPAPQPAPAMAAPIPAAPAAPAPPAAAPAPAAAGTRFCGKCGTPRTPGARFCGSCGSPFA